MPIFINDCDMVDCNTIISVPAANAEHISLTKSRISGAERVIHVRGDVREEMIRNGMPADIPSEAIEDLVDRLLAIRQLPIENQVAEVRASSFTDLLAMGANLQSILSPLIALIATNYPG